MVRSQRSQQGWWNRAGGVSIAIAALLVPPAIVRPAAAATLSSWTFDAATQELTVSVGAGVTPRYFLLANPARIVLDLPNTSLGAVPTEANFGGAVRSIRVAEFQPGQTRLVLELAPDTRLATPQAELRSLAGGQWVLRPRLHGEPDPVPIAAAPPEPGDGESLPDRPDALPSSDPSAAERPAQSIRVVNPGSDRAEIVMSDPEAGLQLTPEMARAIAQGDLDFGIPVAEIIPLVRDPAIVAILQGQAEDAGDAAAVPSVPDAPAATANEAPVASAPPELPPELASDRDLTLPVEGVQIAVEAPPDLPAAAPPRAPIAVPADDPTSIAPAPSPVAPVAVPAADPSLDLPPATPPAAIAPADPTSATLPTFTPGATAAELAALTAQASPQPESGAPMPPAPSVTVPEAPRPAEAVSDAAELADLQPSASPSSGAAALQLPDPTELPAPQATTPQVTVPGLESIPAAPRSRPRSPASTATTPQPDGDQTAATPAPPAAAVAVDAASSPAAIAATAETPVESPPSPSTSAVITFGQPVRSPAATAQVDAVPRSAAAPVLLLSAETVLPLQYPREQALEINANVPWQEVLLLAESVQTTTGQVIPAGTPVIGRFEAGSSGSRFIAQAITINGYPVRLLAESDRLGGDRQVSEQDLLRNSGIGAAATVVGGVLTGGIGIIAGAALGAATGAATTYVTTPQSAIIQPYQIIPVRVVEDVPYPAIGGTP